MRRDVFSVDDAPSVQSENCEPSPKHDEGAICICWVRCGRSWCRCMHGGPKHGPYYARYWWQKGRRYKRYVRREDAAESTAACAVRRQTEQDAREQAEAVREDWRNVRERIRSLEHGEH
jgi:hypothetical protein